DGGGQDLGQRPFGPLHLVGGRQTRGGPESGDEEPTEALLGGGRHDPGPAVYARAPRLDLSTVTMGARFARLKHGEGGVTVKAQATPMPKPVDDSASEPRRACLDEQEILDFASGQLAAAKMPAVEEHLSECDKCTELVAAAAPLVASSMEVTRSLHN